jgi:hypothetical protein
MRAKEILTEAGLAPAAMRRHSGKYLKKFIAKIKAKEPLEIVPDMQARFGEKVILKQSSAKKLLQAWFGTTSFPSDDQLNVTSNGDLIPFDKNVASVELETTTGEKLQQGFFQKTAEFKEGSKDFNSGDITEGALGAAVMARFLSRKEAITEQQVLDIIQQLGAGERVGKNNIKGTVQGKSANDKIYFNLSLNIASYNALYGAAKSGEVHPDILGAIRSSVLFANHNTGVKAALEKIISDKSSNRVTVNADGVSNQRGVKADIFLDLDGTNINLLSLKAGDVKQFGQGSGYNFDALDGFMNDTFGLRVSPALKKKFVDGDVDTSFEAIHKVYAAIASELESEVAGHNINMEASLIERLYKGVRHHATKGADDTSMVILKTTPNAPGYVQLQFGQALRDAMENIDLDVVSSAPGGREPAKIEIWGTGLNELKGRSMFMRMRSNMKSEGGGYIRNIIEMGPLLKNLASIEQQSEVRKPGGKAKPAVAATPEKPTKAKK